jgi:hypothetical protein
MFTGPSFVSILHIQFFFFLIIIIAVFFFTILAFTSANISF